ncbi:hypothetical protein [Halorubrum distributum]|uniref:hypothetical protein n=1 Tax=Halorubrum distributum TaxID=29283 RepID=UPI0006782DAB|nr:hypothetical protein [Halorubrum arcis]
MKRPNDADGGVLNSYGRTQQWQKEPSDEEMEELLEELVGDTEIEIEEREPPLEIEEENRELDLEPDSKRESVLDSA